jgi:elongation factor 1-delta
MACPLANERVWTDKHQYNEAERKYYESLSKGAGSAGGCTLVSEIAKARQHIKDSLERMDGIAALASTPGAELLDRLATVEKENTNLRDTIKKLENLVIDLKSRVVKLEGGSGKAGAPTAAKPVQAKKAEPEDDDDVDLFGSDEEEDAEAAAIREKRLQDYAAKKSKKPALIAKSSIVLDVKCWDDETDMKELERCVRNIKCDGLLWGASKLVPVGYGINKLQISCVVEDEKVSIDWLVEEIEGNENFVQSVDIAAFNKI